jgi:hypothetical protein
MYSLPLSLRSDSELPAWFLSSPCPLPFRPWSSDASFDLPSYPCSTSNPRLPLSSFVPPYASPHLASIRFDPFRVYRQAFRSLRVGDRGTPCKTLSPPLSSGLWSLPRYLHSSSFQPHLRYSHFNASTSMSEAGGVGNGGLDEVPLLSWDVSPRPRAV